MATWDGGKEGGAAGEMAEGVEAAALLIYGARTNGEP
jgi:hypothetical protein